MNYKQNYDNYISYIISLCRKNIRPTTKYQRKNFDTYFEFHHIIPKSFGGKNSKDNLIPLTPREHFLAHYLLTKIYPDSEKMQNSFWIMSHVHNKKISSIQSSNLKLKRLEYLKEFFHHSDKFKKELSKRNKGNTYTKGKHIHSEEFKKKLSERSKNQKTFLGKHHTDEYKKYMSKIMKGRILSEEWKRKIGEKSKGRYIENRGGGFKILCIETNKIYNSINDASKILNLPYCWVQKTILNKDFKNPFNRPTFKKLI
jgi:hypothetical protein